MSRALLVAALVLAAPALADEAPPKLELDLTASDLNGIAVPLGFANAFLGGAGGGVQAVAGMQGVFKKLGPLISSGKVPRSTEEANRIVGSGKSMRGVSSGYQARIHATLVKDGENFVVESGTVSYTLYTSSTISVKDGAIIDRVKASGSEKLSRGDVTVRFSAPPTGGASPTWTLNVGVKHHVSPQGFSDWSVKDGKVMSMHLEYSGDSEVISGTAMGQPWPKETSTARKSMGVRYSVSGQEVTRHTPRRSATWTDITGTQHAVTFTLRWQSDVTAEFSPTAPERGATLELDGSASKGKELTYEWRFEVPPDGCFTGDTGNAGAVKQGKKVSAVLLCDTRVTLKVTDFKHESDENTQLVKVRSRQLKPVAFEMRPEQYGVLGQIMMQSGGLLAPRPWGLNRCAKRDETDHFIHRDPDDKDVVRREVKDADGPFDSWWFVDSLSLEAPRERIINVDLSPQHPRASACDSFAGAVNVYGVNAACNLRNRGVVYDVENARGATSFHEQQHALLFNEALSRTTPHRVLEKTIGSSEQQLRTRAGCVLGIADDVIWQWGNSEVEVAFRVVSNAAYAKSVTLKLRTEGSTAPSLKSFPKIGDKDGLTANPQARAQVREAFEKNVREFESNAKGCARQQ